MSHNECYKMFRLVDNQKTNWCHMWIGIDDTHFMDKRSDRHVLCNVQALNLNKNASQTSVLNKNSIDLCHSLSSEAMTIIINYNNNYQRI